VCLHQKSRLDSERFELRGNHDVIPKTSLTRSRPRQYCCSYCMKRFFGRTSSNKRDVSQSVFRTFDATKPQQSAPLTKCRYSLSRSTLPSFCVGHELDGVCLMYTLCTLQNPMMDLKTMSGVGLSILRRERTLQRASEGRCLIVCSEAIL
jgi:hypothetical protein